MDTRRRTIIAVYGPSNQGKSGTIKKIIDEISNKYPRASVKILIDGGDRKVVITIGKVKIGIESQGDPGSRLEESLIDFANVKCDIIICATRTSGATVEAVNGLSHLYDIVWITNYRSYEKDQEALNQFSAKQITEYLSTIIIKTK